MEPERKTVKIVVVGDGAVGKCFLSFLKNNLGMRAGKTAMMLSYMADKIPANYTPTALDTFQVDIKVGDDVLTLDITDTAGQDEFEKFER